MPRKSSGGPYPPNWKEIADRTKAEASWCCVRCGALNQPGRVLTVHHIDMNPANCEWWNLAALCQQCHLTIQAKVRIEQPYLLPHSDWFRPYVAGYYAAREGRPTDKSYVMDHLDELIRLGVG
jgi:5-methylcytosine-specific restriction endonuclease McrA